MRQAPYTVVAEVALAPPPDTGRIAVRVALDSLHLVARLECAAPNPFGVREATIVASAPPWARVRFGAVEQSADVCRSIDVLSPPKPPLIAFRRLMAGVGAVRTAEGRLTVGAFLGAGVVFGR